MLAVKGFVAGLISAALLAFLLLVPAGLVPGGTWIWPRAIWLVAVVGAVTVVGLVALAIARPASLKVRMQGMIATKEKRQPPADAVISGMLVGLSPDVAGFHPHRCLPSAFATPSFCAHLSLGRRRRHRRNSDGPGCSGAE